jgi:hypothetical protein
MECGKRGHIKCTSEKKSLKIKIDTEVKDDLDEFVAYQHKKYQNEKEHSEKQSFDYVDEDDEGEKWLKQNTNVVPPKKT